MPQATKKKRKKKSKGFAIAGVNVPLGTTRDVFLEVSQTYTGAPVGLPIRVMRGPEPGPAVFFTGAVHGDELNGTGIIRQVMFDAPALQCGTLVCVPVVNIFGFENHSRYLPDRRDLNRCFPGTPDGSMANRLAWAVCDQVIDQCDYGVDMHTAAIRRTNFPNIRGDLSNEGVVALARAFGCEVIVDTPGDEGALRNVACDRGCPTILLEAGEVLKFQPTIVELGVRGALNVLRSLGMLAGRVVRPAYQAEARRTRWVRASRGGILVFHVRPGELVDKGDVLATCTDLYGNESQPVTTPVDGIVIGMTTLPAVKPGEPICNLALPSRSLESIRQDIARKPGSLHRRMQEDLATDVTVRDHPPTDRPGSATGSAGSGS